jgi:uncharacterized protein YcbK (DUF882 family)
MISRFLKSSFVAIMATVLFGLSFVSQADAETRVLSLHFAHSGESITVAYKKDGRYLPDGMRKLNWFFRDWRRNTATKMDPVTIDLLWELYQDLGAKKPAEIISGYRSAATNGMLRRIGRKVARHSQHIRGKAIDVYFPDVPTSRLRGSALARKIGGVGFYPRSGKYGFVHIDSGSVRHWPRMSPQRLASTISRYRSTIGARHLRRSRPTTLVASAAKSQRRGPLNITPGLPRRKPAVRRASFIPLPRPRPLAVAMAAVAADKTFVIPASAPGGKQNFGSGPTLVKNGVSVLLADSNLSDGSRTLVQRSNVAAKGSFVGSLRSGTARQVPLLNPMQASYNKQGFWWSGDMNHLIRRDGAPRAFSNGEDVIVPRTQLSGNDKSALASMIAALTGGNKVLSGQAVVRHKKSDSLRVNRAAKSDMWSVRRKYRVKRKRLKQAQLASDKMAGHFEAVLKSADKPVGFAQ